MLHNGIHSDMLSILNHISLISSQKLTPLLNPLDLISLLIKLETQLVSHPRLALPEWNCENMEHVQIYETAIIYDVKHLICSTTHSPS